MKHSKRKENMLSTVAALTHLLEPGLLGSYTWFEAVEVIAFGSKQENGEARVQNIFSMYVAETGECPQKPKQLFLNKKSKKLKKLDEFSFRVTKRPVKIAELLACIDRYGQTGVWIPPDQKALEVGELVATPPTFCPPDSHTEVPLNAILKNNFWSGSYVIELKDEGKSTLTDLVREDALFEELSDWLATMVPMNISRVPDRIGDVLFQIPSCALIAEFRRPPNMPVRLDMAWHPGIVARPVVGEYRVEQDGLITCMERFEFAVGTSHLDIPPNSGDLRFSVWDTQKQLLLAATAPLHAPGGKWRIESSMSTGIEQPRRFNLLGIDNTVEQHEIALMEPSGGSRSDWQPSPPEEINWRARRELKARMKQLVASRRFVQYGISNASPQEERRRALDDIRHLIRSESKGAIYLWDPYLSANDVLNTLAFCADAGTKLFGLTSAKSSKKSPSVDDDKNGTDTVLKTDREAWMKTQRDILNSAFIGPSHIKLEFRMSWGSQGSFHDRFLIFPGRGSSRTQVWSLGASINHIGAQHCIVQEVAYPEPVLQAFKAFWDQSNQPEHLIWKYS
jgi:hypothetical protein